MDRWIDGCMDAWMHRCMDGRREGWIHGSMDPSIDRSSSHECFQHFLSLLPLGNALGKTLLLSNPSHFHKPVKTCGNLQQLLEHFLSLVLGVLHSPHNTLLEYINQSKRIQSFCQANPIGSEHVYTSRMH